MAASGGGLRFRVLISLLLLSCGLLLRQIHAQPGFISIDCGSTSNYTDQSTGIFWSTDEQYTSTGVNKAVISVSASTTQLKTARYFDKPRSKNCYVLPAVSNATYLIRALFLFGNLDVTLPQGYGFSLSIDTTVVQIFSLAQADVDSLSVWEFVVAATSDEIDFCIVTGVGKPFISALELRPFLSTMYRGVVYESKYLKSLDRLNCGAAPTDPIVRYPDDVYDRFWGSPGPEYKITTLSTVSKIDIGPLSLDNPPEVVMQSAWFGNGTFWFYWPFEEATTKFYLALYFAEVQVIKTTDFRSLDMFINGETDADRVYRYYNFSTTAGELYNENLPLSTGSINITLKQSDISTLPPLLNGVELLGIYDTIQASTTRQDLQTLTDLRQHFDLLDWTGDPCLPVSWDWLNCTSNNPPVVTEVILSGYNLQGTIPPSVLRLAQLTDLWLDHNNISGMIPDFSSLVNLKTLHLENNSLSGPIPASLASLPLLTELYLEGNNLGPVPAALLNKSGLTVRSDSGSSSGSAPSSSKKKSSIGVAIGGAIAGVVVVVLIIALCICCLRTRMAPKPVPNGVVGGHPGVSSGSVHSDPMRRGRGDGSSNAQLHSARAFSLEEVQVATGNFNRMIGEGGFGPVFYGQLSNGVEVAVKVNSATSRQGWTEFLNEVSLLSRVHHRNLVTLVGYCEEGGQQILLYEFMHIGTLRQNLYGKDVSKVVDWPTRLDIALNAARGLEYLHNDCNPKIIHRDVKSNNILLNEKLLAKVADFGISKSTPDDDNTGGFSTVVRGTTGYLDPEYFVTNKLTYKSDVYAFGVVLLELICGRAPFDNTILDDLTRNLVEFARNSLRERNLTAIVDPALAGTYHEEAMWKLAELAMFSVEPRSVNRPDMRQVVQGVSEIVTLQNKQAIPSQIGGFIPGGGQRAPLLNFTDSSNTGSSSQSSQSYTPRSLQDTRSLQDPLIKPTAR